MSWRSVQEIGSCRSGGFGVQVRNVEQQVLPAEFLECIAGLHLTDHPVEIGVVECDIMTNVVFVNLMMRYCRKRRLKGIYEKWQEREEIVGNRRNCRRVSG